MEHVHAALAEQIEITDSPAISTVVRVAHDHPADELPRLFDETFSALPGVLGEHGLAPWGPALGVFRRPPANTVDLEIGFPVGARLPASVEVAPGFVFAPGELPAGRIARLSHIGGFEGLPESWRRFLAGIRDLGEAPGLPFWELYVTEPSPDADPATMRTDLVVLLA